MSRQYSDSNVNKGICECIDCFSQATTAIEVSVGVLGVIPLFLCQNCLSKFQDDQK
jgi:hypothetical protein